MNLLKLKYFYTVILEGSFTKAALTLRVAQPSLSKMIKEFESELGFQLIERSKRSLALTADGSKVFDHAQRIFEEVRSLEKSLKGKEDRIHGPLKLGATDLIAAELLPGCIGRMMKKHAEVHPFIQTGTVTSLCSMVANRELDFALSFYLPDDLSGDLIEEDLSYFDFHLVVSSANNRDKETLQSFIGSREVDSEKKRFPALDRLRKMYPEAKITLSTNSLLSHLKYVRAGLGVAILPAFLVQRGIQSGRLTKLFPREKFSFPLKMIRRKNSPLSPNSEKFLEILGLELTKFS